MTHNQLWNAIDNFAANHGMSCCALARHSNLDATVFNKSKRFYDNGQPRWISMYCIAKILNATNTTLTDFAKFVDTAQDAEKEY